MRTSQINIRVSPAEQALWQELKVRYDMPLAEIARRALNGLAVGKIKNLPLVPRPGGKPDRESDISTQE